MAIGPTKQIVRLRRIAAFVSISASTFCLAACSDDGEDEPSDDGNAGTAGTGGLDAGAGGANAGTGGLDAGAGGANAGTGGAHFNQCGVAAPLPAATGQCTVVNAPTIADFDDYAGAEAASYTYYVNGAPPAAGALLGSLQHVGDGSDMGGGTSVIATEMVPGENDAGYALQISNSNATVWGGLLMFYFPYSGTTAACLDASNYAGVQFSIRGASPSGRFGVALGMLDTIPTGSNGLCDNGPTSDCKDATLELRLPADAEAWTQVRVPWSAFTPGIGSDLSCVPVTGHNLVRVVIQPFMSYPPPNYTFEPGPYTLAVDDVRLY